MQAKFFLSNNKLNDERVFLKPLVLEEKYNTGLFIYTNDIFHIWHSKDGHCFIVIGNVIGYRKPDGTLLGNYVLKIDASPFEEQNSLRDIEGYFIVLKFNPQDKSIQIWRDSAGRVDLYYHKREKSLSIGSSIDLLPIHESIQEISAVGLAHTLTVYGARPAKKDTIYKNVERLGVDESFILKANELKVEAFKMNLPPKLDYNDKGLDKYTNLFLESIKARASNKGNIVYLSSGWDSTSILACLVHLLGNRKVRAVIGRMRYSDRAGVINQFEIDRAMSVAEYYKVKIEICDLDYRHNAEQIIDELKPLFRSQQFYAHTGINHWMLAKHTANAEGSRGQTVFAGEMSDGAHNFGFSQYATIFHPASYDFREYSDKMACYLYSPTFMKEIISGKFKDDPIWKIFKERYQNFIFDTEALEEVDRKLQVLESLFASPGRLPFFSIENASILSSPGRKDYSNHMKSRYLNKMKDLLDPETLYAIIIYLYNSFHWQASTVATLEHTADYHGLNAALPFHDNRLIEFLSNMPESWGRGLELKPTKYPLKWMLENRIDYPMHLQTGPHSYLYDVDPSFSHSAELLYHSSFTPLFKKNLKSSNLIQRIPESHFNKNYIQKIVEEYLSGKTHVGTELSDLFNLGMISTIGIY